MRQVHRGGEVAHRVLAEVLEDERFPIYFERTCLCSKAEQSEIDKFGCFSSFDNVFFLADPFNTDTWSTYKRPLYYSPLWWVFLMNVSDSIILATHLAPSLSIHS